MPTKKISFSQVFEACEGKCTYCRTNLGDEFERVWLAQRDRLLPGSKGGEYTAENTVLACAVCNNLRGNYTPQDLELTADNRAEYIRAISSEVDRRRKLKQDEDFASWASSREEWEREDT